MCVFQLLLQQELIRRQQALALQQQNTGTSDQTVHTQSVGSPRSLNQQQVYSVFVAVSVYSHGPARLTAWR